MKREPSQEFLRSMFSYCEDDGVFIRIINSSNAKIGDVAGYVNELGYCIISVKNKLFSAHRLAWTYVHGEIPDEMEVDHINGNPSDNRIENLRLATRLQNAANRKMHKNNLSGYKGVYLDSRRKNVKQWRASIVVQKKKLSLGIFSSPEDAHEAYKKAAEKYFGEFARN